VVGNQSVAHSFPRPLPIGNLSNTEGEAACYFLNDRFYCFSHFLVRTFLFIKKYIQIYYSKLEFLSYKASYDNAANYCKLHKMSLLSIRSEEEHEYLFDFLSNHHQHSHGLHSSNHGHHHSIVPGSSDIALHLRRTEELSALNEEEYGTHVENNIGAGMLIECLAVCGQNVRPGRDKGRVLDYEQREYIGFAVKVQWPTGFVRWYPAVNIQIVGYGSIKRHTTSTEDQLSLEENILFEPGDRVRLKYDSITKSGGEIGVISFIDFNGEAALVRFPSNPGWRGLLDDLEIVDKRKASGAYWTSGNLNIDGGDASKWIWRHEAGVGQPMEFSNWAEGQPVSPPSGLTDENGLPVKYHCLVIKYHLHGKWFATRCQSKNYFICQS